MIELNASNQHEKLRIHFFNFINIKFSKLNTTFMHKPQLYNFQHRINYLYLCIENSNETDQSLLSLHNFENIIYDQEKYINKTFHIKKFHQNFWITNDFSCTTHFFSTRSICATSYRNFHHFQIAISLQFRKRKPTYKQATRTGQLTEKGCRLVPDSHRLKIRSRITLLRTAVIWRAIFVQNT